jgi:hypothetical protein
MTAGRRDIIVPYGAKLATKVRVSERRDSVRLRCDYPQALKAIKTHALLHYDQRDKDENGAIIANGEDYANVRELMVPWFSHSTATCPLMQATVEAVGVLQKAMSGVTAMAVGDYLSIHKSTALRRLRSAELVGLVVNLESQPSRAGQYRTTLDAGEVATLPEWGELA